MMRRIGCAVWVGFVAATAVHASEPRKDAVRLPPDLFPPQVGDARGVLELRGDKVHNSGQLRTHVTNFGLLGSMPGAGAPFSGAASVQWPSGSDVDYLWAGGLWVGSEVNGAPLVTGLVHEGSDVRFEFRPSPGELDRIYRTRAASPGGIRFPFPNADDDGDETADEDRLDGLDNDGDGKIDEDYAALGSEMFVCEFGDADPRIQLHVPDHQPLGLQVRQTSIVWEDANAADFVAFDYELTNVGNEILRQTYIGFYLDCDIGRRGRPGVALDDQGGFWEGTRTLRFGGKPRQVPIALAYMYDADGDEGTAAGYIGCVFLGVTRPFDRSRPLPMRNFRLFSGRGSFDEGGDPTNDEQRYRVLSGAAPRSLAEPRPGVVRPAQRTLRQEDYRMVVSAGPLGEIGPGLTLRFQMAIVLGRGLDELIDHAVQAQVTYDGRWMDCDGNPTTGVDGLDTRLCGPVDSGSFEVDPCDSTCLGNPDPPCVVRVPVDDCIWVNGDCDLETASGIRTGIGGRECHVPWLETSAPTPPRLRVVAREGAVDIYWDNRSETMSDPVSGALDFESYRIWRADGWRRPIGSTTATGPGAELWQLLAEFDLDRNSVGSNRGLESIRYQPAVPEHAVQFYREWFHAHASAAPPEVPGLTAAQRDTAQALARGVRYYRFTDPPFLEGGRITGICGPNGRCAPFVLGRDLLPARCNERGQCQLTSAPPHTGVPYFYSVTATDHAVALDSLTGMFQIRGPGLAGPPSGNFVFVTTPSTALAPDEAGRAEDEIYVVPNPARRSSLAPWQLFPNNDDPTGVKVEFHHLPRSAGTVTIWTLAGDRVAELPFDGRQGNGTRTWDLLSRNGQEVASGVYLYTVEAQDPRFRKVIGKLVVIR